MRLLGLTDWRSGRAVDLVLSQAADSALIDETGAMSAEASQIDASGLVLAPALVDPHVHLRDPGQPDKEDMVTGTAAAAAGGYGLILLMPNTQPAMDGDAKMTDGRTVIEYLESYERDHGLRLPVDYALCVAATLDRAGRQASNPDHWSDHLPGHEWAHPVVAISDDGSAVTDQTLEAVAANARAFDLPLLDHCEHHDRGQINLGAVSHQLGLEGIPASTEISIINRDIELAERTGTQVHLQHVSTAGGFEAVRRAKARRLSVTCETAPHYLALCDEDLLRSGSMAKMNPPLRSRADQQAALEAVADGTVDMIATDHAPHTAAEKALGLEDAPNGIIGLETAYAVCNQVLVKSGLIDHDRLIELMSLAPAELLGMHRLLPEDLSLHKANKLNKTGHLQLEADRHSDANLPPVDLVILDPDARWEVDPSHFHSKARNTPFAETELAGRVMATIKDGRLVFSRLPASRVITRERIRACTV